MFRDLMVRMTAAALALALSLGCKKSESAPSGLPAADDWTAPSPMGSAVAGGHGGADPHAGMDMGGADPHAGMDMGGADPHAGMDMGGADPHAGMDMGGADPHAGMDMGDPQMAAIQPPDPDRPIDESKFLEGKITAGPKIAVKPGSILFLSVRPIDPTTGEIIGGPIAVQRIDVAELPVSFRLTGRDAMSAGTRFEGDVLIQARIDGDGEARTREPGDIAGEARAKIPAKSIALVLDDVLR